MVRNKVIDTAIEALRALGRAEGLRRAANCLRSLAAEELGTAETALHHLERDENPRAQGKHRE